MKNSKRILSFLMAIIILSSVFSVAASAYAPYKDGALTNYDDIDRPAFTLDQCSSMVLDYVDKMLAEKNMTIDMSVLGTLNLTSVDNALNGIYDLLNGATFLLFKGLLGDLKDLDKSGLSTYRRASTPAASADTNVIYSLTEFLSDNKTIVSKLVDGSLNMGIFNSMIDIGSINVEQMIKKALYQTANPNTKLETTDPLYVVTPDPITDTADNMVQAIINGFIVGTDENPGIAPQLAGCINVVNTTAVAYDFTDGLLQNIYNLILVPLLNGPFREVVRKACGVVYDENNPLDPGDESNLNEYADYFDIHYVVPPHIFLTGATPISEINNILYDVINAITIGYAPANWIKGDNSLTLNNLATAAEYVLNIVGNIFFTDSDGKIAQYVAVATTAELSAMNNQELFSYIARSLVNSKVDEMNIPADADTLVEVAWYAVKEILAQIVPQFDYSAQPKTLAGILNMLADLAVYFINQSADMNPAAGTTPGTGLLAYSQGFDATLLSIMKWVKTNYGGLLTTTLTGTDGWADLNTLVTAIIPSNWINGFTTVKDLVENKVLQNILDLNTTNLFALFDRRPDSEFATKTIKKVLIDTVVRLVNVVFPSALKTTYTTFEQIIVNTELKTVLENVFGQLYTRRLSIIPAAIPLAANATGISTPAEYVNPTLVLPKQISTAMTFPIFNNSKGLNTGATNKAGVFTQDSLYKIKIVSIASSIPAITLTNLVGTVINGGDSVNCTLSGTFPAGQVLMVTMKYNVYTELGDKLTDYPLTVRAFSCISGSVDDGANYTTLDTNTGNSHTMKYKNIYCNQNYTLADLAAQDQFVVERATTSSTDNSKVATVTRTSATANATLVANGITAAAFTNISTTFDGGAWNVPPFVVAPSATRPADGAYSSTFAYSASATKPLLGTVENFSITHYVVFYNDFNLPGLLNSEIEAKRDPVNYSGGESGQEWLDYIDALKNAIAVQYRPRAASTFMTIQAPAYENAYTMLTDAVTALKVTEVATVAMLKDALDAIEPPNTKEYDDPAYNYFGGDDFVAYTFTRYEKERSVAYGLWASQQAPAAPVLPPSPTPVQQTAYDTAYAQYLVALSTFNANKPDLKLVDVVYAIHRLNLYASRLVRVPTEKARLSEDLARIQDLGLDQGQYTTLSWTTYQKALTFAVSVNAQSATATDTNGEYVLRQTKVNTAREELNAAYKKLIVAKTFLVPLKPGVVIGLPGFPYLLAGLGVGIGASGYVGASEGGYVVFNDGPGGPGTGATVDLFTNSGSLKDTYTVIIYGDVNGDGNIDGNDAGIIFDYENYNITWDPVADAAKFKAADLNRDGNIGSQDAGIIVDYENYFMYIDQTTGVPSMITEIDGSVSITGIAQYGNTLGVDISVITPAGATITYMWNRNGEAIGTGNTYDIVVGDIGESITVTITGYGAYQGGIRSGEVVPTKIDVPPPAAPTFATKTQASVTLNAVTGQEYKIEGGEWQTSAEFTGLSSNTTYDFYTRVKETDTSFASPASTALSEKTIEIIEIDGSVTITGIAEYGNALEAVISVITPAGATITYMWNRSGAEIGTGSTYVITAEDIGKSITVTVMGYGAYKGGFRSGEVVPLKRDVPAPAAPTFATKTQASVTLNAVNGQEYKIEGGEWQTSAVFTGLNPNTAYNFYTRVKETDTTYASPASALLSITTNEATISGSVIITGSAIVGETLTADISGIIPGGATITYKWNEGDVHIGTGSTYTIIKGDIGKSISVTVTGTGDYNGSIQSPARVIIG